MHLHWTLVALAWVRWTSRTGCKDSHPSSLHDTHDTYDAVCTYAWADFCKEAAAPCREYVTEGEGRSLSTCRTDGPIIYSRLSFLGPLPARPERERENCSVQVRRRENRPFLYRSNRKRWESRGRVGPGSIGFLCIRYLAIISGGRSRECVGRWFYCLPKQGRSKVSLADQACRAEQSKASEQIRWTNHCRQTPHTAHVGRDGGLRGLLKLKMNKTPACRHLRPRCPDCDECWLGNLDFRPMYVCVFVCVWLQLCFLFPLGVWSDDLFDVRPLAPQSDMPCLPGAGVLVGGERSPIPLPGIGRAFRRCKTVEFLKTCTRYTHTHMHTHARPGTHAWFLPASREPSNSQSLGGGRAGPETTHRRER